MLNMLVLLLIGCLLLLIPLEASYTCGKNVTCSEKCVEFLGLLKGDNKNSRSWGARHPYLGEFYKKHDVKIVTEIGIAYGGLSRYVSFLSPLNY